MKKITYKNLNYETCHELALKCSSRKEFWTKHIYAASLSHKNGWLDEWFPSVNRKKRNYWTKEKCIEESKKYASRKEFDKNARGAYSAASKNGWLDEFTWLKNKKTNFSTEKIDCVYKYFFKETNAIYIGRTIRRKERDWSHIFAINKDTVAKYAYENNLKVPPMEIVEDNLTLEEGQIKEKYWIDFYAKNGYKILNKAKGGALGSISTKWTFDKTYAEAKKYTTLSDFRKNSPSAYIAAKKNRWQLKYTWLEIKKTHKIRTEQRYFTKKECLKKAKNCKTLSEFKNKYHKYYLTCKYWNWFKDITWFNTRKPNNYWTYEKCMEIAKTFTLKKDLKQKYPYLYEVAQKNKWLKEYTWLKGTNNPNGYWTYEKCFEEAKKYTNLSDFNKNGKGAPYRARVNGWIKDYTWFKLK